MRKYNVPNNVYLNIHGDGTFYDHKTIDHISMFEIGNSILLVAVYYETNTPLYAHTVYTHTRSLPLRVKFHIKTKKNVCHFFSCRLDIGSTLHMEKLKNQINKKMIDFYRHGYLKMVFQNKETENQKNLKEVEIIIQEKFTISIFSVRSY